MVRMARVDRRRRKDWPSASDNSEVTWRLGKNRRRVLLLAWLTLLPLNTPLPVISQRRDIEVLGSEEAGLMTARRWFVKDERGIGPSWLPFAVCRSTKKIDPAYT